VSLFNDEYGITEKQCRRIVMVAALFLLSKQCAKLSSLQSAAASGKKISYSDEIKENKPSRHHYGSRDGQRERTLKALWCQSIDTHAS